jgi:fibronectin type 3 domain-containing protein
MSSTKQKPEATYVDTLPESIQSDLPGAFATYAVEALNKEGRGAGISNRVKVPLARTLPPPEDFQAQVTSQGIVLHWTTAIEPVSKTGLRYVYRVYRTAMGSSERSMVGEVAVNGQHNYSLPDTTFEWEKTYTYRAETVTVFEQPNHPLIQIEGDDTPEVKVFADDVFPPTVPTSLQAVFSGPGQKLFIDLIWAPVTNADLAGYNVYRRGADGASVKINSDLVRTPAYRDASVEGGKKYFYSVSSVDLRGNESARSEEAVESTP